MSRPRGTIRPRQRSLAWAVGCLGLLILAGVALVAARGAFADRVEVALVLMIPGVVGLAMATPNTGLDSFGSWSRTGTAVAVTVLVAVLPALSKLTAAPIFQSASVRAGEAIPLPPGTGRVRIALQAALADRKDAIARVTLAVGPEVTEVIFRPRVFHARGKGRSTLHVAVRDPAIEEVRLAVSEPAGLRLTAITGELDGPVAVEVFAEWLPPLAVLGLSAALLLVLGIVKRRFGLPNNSLVAAGAALGFGCLLYARGGSQTLARDALGPAAGGLIAGAAVGGFARWLLVPRPGRAARRNAGAR